MPRPNRRASEGEPRLRGRPPISTKPLSGARKPLAIPSNVDFPDPFSPTSACTSPARQSKLTSRSACTAPNAFDTPRSESTTGLSGPGVDNSLAWDLLLAAVVLLTRVHPMQQFQRHQRGGRRLLRVALDTFRALGLALQLDREHDLGRDLRALELHHPGRQGDADLRVPGGVVEDLQLRVTQPLRGTAHADVVRSKRQHRVERLARGLVGRERALRHAEPVLVAP